MCIRDRKKVAKKFVVPNADGSSTTFVVYEDGSVTQSITPAGQKRANAPTPLALPNQQAMNNPNMQAQFAQQIQLSPVLGAGGGVTQQVSSGSQLLRTQLIIEPNSLLQQNLIGYLIANLKRNLRGET